MPAELPNAYGPVEAQVHPLSTRWPKSAAVLAVLALGACAPDQTVSTSPDVQDFASAARNTIDYSSVTLSGEVSLKVGTSTKLSVRTSSRSRGSIKWQSSNPSAATVNSQGNVTGQAVGSAYVTASGFAVNETYLVSVTPAYTLTSFTVSPTTGTALAPGQTRQFSTQQLWSDGQTRNFGVTYTATGGSISSSGLFTAGSVAGSFMVIANCLCGALDTAFVTVEVPAQLTKITVSPKTVSLNAGATQQFGATANWSTGATTLPPITWSATGGSISTSGLYTAPTTAGTYRVIVAHSGGTLRDTATVTVTVTTAPPPPDGGTTTPQLGAGPNEPTGFTTAFSNPMATLPPRNPLRDSFGFVNFFGTSTLSIQSEAGGQYMRALFPQGTPGGGGYPSAFASVNWAAASEGMSQMYVRTRVRLSSNWTDNGNAGTKFFFFLSQQGHNHYINLTFLGDFRPGLGLQSDFAFSTPSGPNHFAPAPLAKGVWQDLEFLFVGNTPGQYNGKYRMWANGVLLVSRDDIGYFKAGDVPRFEEIYFNPTYGGGFNPVPADQSLDLDHWYLSLKK